MPELPRFELPSAKNLSVTRAVDYFVPTQLYWKTLYSDTHDVIYGTRGSGKTMLLRMMSVQHLARFAGQNDDARKALYEDRRFGLFLPLGIDWCVAYQRGGDEQRLFVDGMNLVAAYTFVETLDEIFQSAVVKLENPDATEVAVSDMLAKLWFRRAEKRVVSFLTLKDLIEAQQSILADIWLGVTEPPSRQVQLDANYRFKAGSLFKPLVDAISKTNRLLGLGEEQTWLLCLDELEDLTPLQLRVINTALRSRLANLVLKITTQPYTLEDTTTTYAAQATSVDFREYEVRRLEYGAGDSEYLKLATEMLRKRIQEIDGTAHVGEKVFGTAEFADIAAAKTPQDQSQRFVELRDRLLTAGQRDSSRKKIPVAAIRWLRRNLKGNRKRDVYSGWKTIVLASDGNPGMLVRLFNQMRVGPHTEEKVDASFQHEVLTELAEAWHEWSQALYPDGSTLYALIDQLGTYLSNRLHSGETRDEDVQEEVNRFLVDFERMDDRSAEAFRVGARHALLVAEANQSSLRYPTRKGVWRLSYALAPKYWLLLRRGKAVALRERQLGLGLDRHGPDTGLSVEELNSEEVEGMSEAEGGEASL